MNAPLRFASPQSRTSLILACERCHKNKEKCRYSKGAQTCDNCQRIGIGCRTRVKKRMGRKPVVKQFAHGSTSILPLKAGSSDLILSTPKARQMHQRRKAYHHSPTSYYANLGGFVYVKKILQAARRCFSMGTSLFTDLQSAVLLAFMHSPNVLADGYHELINFMGDHRWRSLTLQNLDLTIGSRTLRSFIGMSKSIVHAEDAAVVLMLGQILLAYNAMIPLGSSTHTITRSALWSVEKWYPLMLDEGRLDAITVTPVLIDTIDCLIRRNLPVIRPPHSKVWAVDRFSGICASLLPLLYDLCECSARMKREVEHKCHVSLGNLYEEVERAIALWEPTYPSDLICRFTTTEVAAMFAQAQAYRLASLLIIHRLRFPLGTEDVVAKHYASHILDTSCPLTRIPDAAIGLTVDFPLLVAMVELPHLGAKVFQSFEPLRYRKRQSEDVLGFVTLVDQARKSGYQGLWFDLVKDGFKGDIFP